MQVLESSLAILQVTPREIHPRNPGLRYIPKLILFYLSSVYYANHEPLTATQVETFYFHHSV